MYPHITKHIFDEWQEIWNCCAGNKLHAIKPTVGGYKQKTYVLNIVVSCRHICLRLSHLLSIDCCSISTYWHKLKYCVMHKAGCVAEGEMPCLFVDKCMVEMSVIFTMWLSCHLITHHLL